jgi:hypothetical protein
MKNKYKFILGVLVVLLAIRLVLPYVVLHYSNRTLATMKGYYGHIDDIGLSLYRGAYVIKNIYINKTDPFSKLQTPFFKSRNIDLSLEWEALFHGSLVGKLIFNSPDLIFTKDVSELGDVKKDTASFRKLLKTFMPLKVNRFEINNGSIHYVDNSSTPKVDVSLKQTHVIATNLTNVIDKTIELPSTVTAHASVYGGTFDLAMRLNALADKAKFELNAEIKNANLVLLNDFLKAYGKFDVNRGSFSMYSEMAAKNGKFKGYVKPIITDLKVLGPQDRNDSFFDKIWEALVGAAGVVFRNQNKDQLATKVQIEGDYSDPKVDTFEAIWEFLKNAFIQALMPKIDHEININSIKPDKPKDNRNLLQKIFSSKKKN